MRRKLIICLTILVVIISSCHPYTAVSRTKKQAIESAEDFIRRNGYTKMPVDTSKYKLSYSMSELSDLEEQRYGLYTIDTLLQRRHDLFYPKAFCISYDARHKRWLVGFIYTEVDLDKLDATARNSDLRGTAIIVSDSTTEISHEDALFSHFEKL